MSDNNATGQLVEVDVQTGLVVRTIGGFEFDTTQFLQPPGKSTEQDVQLDPATRTGWTFSPDGVQLQRFHY